MIKIKQVKTFAELEFQTENLWIMNASPSELYLALWELLQKKKKKEYKILICGVTYFRIILSLQRWMYFVNH